MEGKGKEGSELSTPTRPNQGDKKANFTEWTQQSGWRKKLLEENHQYLVTAT